MDEIVDPHTEVQLPALLRKMADLHGGADLHMAAVRLQLPGCQMQQRGFARAVAAHDADAVAAEEIVGEIVDDGAAVEGLADAMKLHDLPPQAAGRRAQLQCIVGFRGILVQQVLIPLDTLFRFGGPGLAAPHDPFPLDPQDGLALALAGLRHLRPLGFQFQIFGIVGFVVVQLSPGQLCDVVHHPFQKIAVVGHHDEAAPEGTQPLLQPGHHFAVQMVRGLVQHQHIRRVDQRGDQGHPLALAAGEGVHLLGKVRKAQLRQHGLGFIFIQFPEFLREVQEHLFQHRGMVVHHRILGEEADLGVGIAGDPPLVRFQIAGQYLQKSGLAGAVDADHAHLVPVIEIKIHIRQQLPAAEIDGKMFCR